MEYILVRARKRTLSLQVTQTGEVVARAPIFMPKFLIDRFIDEKKPWIAKRLKELTKPASPKVAYFTEANLHKYIEREVVKYSKIMGLHPTNLRFTQVTSYWGTCAPSGILSFNLSLRFTPSNVITYVIIHELAHLRWKGHGKRFWELVKKTYPPTDEMRKILRKIPHTISRAQLP
ncbi:MAG: hypothetical protein ACD_40C00145G0012 [uncultured bacterium]|nr:MAG: hypothetical protein ACD_40C00145G0012 [uncultured bacterium]